MPSLQQLSESCKRLQVKPEDARYTVNVPEGIAALNLDIMRMCAQMVARNGKNFLRSESPWHAHPWLHCQPCC